MTTEPYVPDWTDIRDRYAFHTSVHTGATVDEARRDAERGIAKIKADALREAANELSQMNTRAGVADPTRDSRRVRAMADRIEEEA